jgi:outer membrane protein OmpA-like peptidoglycan-associated protein
MRWDRIWTQGFGDKKPLLQSLIPIHPPHERRVEIYIKTQ